MVILAFFLADPILDALDDLIDGLPVDWEGFLGNLFLFLLASRYLERVFFVLEVFPETGRTQRGVTVHVGEFPVFDAREADLFRSNLLHNLSLHLLLDELS